MTPPLPLYLGVVLSVTGLTTMAQTNRLKLDRVQNEAKRVILGTTKDTPTETTRFMLGLPPMQTRQKVEQVKAYFSAVEIPHNPVHEAVKDTKGCRLGLGWAKQRTQCCKYVSLQAASKPRSGKGTQTDFGVSIRHSCQKTWGNTLGNAQQAKQRSSFSFNKTANRKTS